MAISLSLNTTPTTSVGCVEGTVFHIPDKYTTDDELKKAIAEIPKPDLSGFATKTEVAEKQDVLLSGINIKTVNGESILGEGNIEFPKYEIPVIPEGGGGNSEVVIITQSQFDSLLSEGKISETSLYFIKDGNTPIALYIGPILIAQKDELGNISFPYNFPITF